MDEHYRKLENMYLAAPVNHFYNPTITISTAAAEISIHTEEKHFHAANATHGSVYFKMLDDAAFFAAQSVVQDVFVLTSQFNVHLLRPIFAERITSRGSILSRTRSTILAESTLINEKGKILATGRGSFALGRTPLSPVIGYRL